MTMPRTHATPTTETTARTQVCEDFAAHRTRAKKAPKAADAPATLPSEMDTHTLASTDVRPLAFPQTDLACARCGAVVGFLRNDLCSACTPCFVCQALSGHTG